MIPSAFSGQGLSILVSFPIVQGGEMIGNYADIVNSYSHVKSANGGYISADFTLVGNNEFLEDWLQYGLGRDIKVFGPSLQNIWEGFVNQVDVNMGGATFTRGPLVNVANRVSAMYTPLIDPCPDLIADPNCDNSKPATGTTTETLIVEDKYSQTKYGIWEKVLNIGNVWPDDADYIRDLYLTENAYPEGNPSLSISSSEGDLSVKISCRGYIDWLGYVYNNKCADADIALSIYASDKIKAILTADPNHIISSLYDRINYNPVLSYDQECDNKVAKTLIDDIINLGGGNDDRWTFGIYADRKPIYSAIPTSVEYIYYKTGQTQQIESINGQKIAPWDVLPCKWVAIPTFLTSFGTKIEDIRNDPRIFFAEEVSFTAPDQVTISGAKVRKLSQYMAKLGLGGV